MPANGSLFPRHFTLFAKKLRAAQTKMERPFSYYVAGEYGDIGDRPHYHAVLFGPEFLDKEVRLERHGAPVYYSDSLEAVWGHGFVEFTGLTYAGARYAASYVRKKVRQKDDPNAYVRVDPCTGELLEIEREFGRMSRNPAIGRTFIERFWKDVYPRDFVALDGRPLKPPRYYDKWMEQGHPVDTPCGGGCREHVEVMEAVKRQRYEDIVDIGHEALIMAEKCHRARVNLFQGRGAV